MPNVFESLNEIRNRSIRVVLGSGSNPRRNLFQQLNIPFEVQVSDFPEDLRKEDFQDKSEYPLATSLGKTEHIMNIIQRTTPQETIILITCDSVIIRQEDQVVLEKPESAEHAISILKSLSSKTHLVATGVVVTLLGKELQDRLKFVEATAVTFADLSDAEIRTYVESGEPFGKAGGYAIQGLGAILVEKLEGSFDNVVGIPLRRVATAIAELLERNRDKLV